MKIHFIYPDMNNFGTGSVQQGIASISAVLKSNDHKTSLQHVIVKPSKQEFIKDINKISPDLVCFSSTTNQHNFVKLFSLWIKEELNIPILCGGVHTTLSPEEVIADDNIDIICIGEGEYPLFELANNLEDGKTIDNINNLWIKNDNKIIKNPLRTLIPNLDRLPFPDYDLFDYGKVLARNNYTAIFMAGRGCPFNCTYCSNHALRAIYQDKGPYIRHKSVDYLLQEIENITERYNVKRIAFNDDTFTLSSKWTKEFCEKYPKRFNFNFSCNARADIINKKTFPLLKDAGCDMINFGIESGSEWLRKNVLKRDMTNNQIIEAFNNSKKLGMKTYSYSMIGIPFETPVMVQETINLNKLVSPDIMQVSIFYPYPQTELWRICKENGFLTEKHLTNYFEESPLNLSTLTKKELKNYYRKMNMMSLERSIKTNYSSLYYPFKITNFILGGKTRKFLNFARNFYFNLKAKIIDIEK